MARPKGIDWAAVREAYAAGTPISHLATQFDVASTTIYARRERDASNGVIWQRRDEASEESGGVESRAETPPKRSNVVDFPRTGMKAVDNAIESHGLDLDLDRIATATLDDVLKSQAGLAVMMAAMSQKLMADFISGDLKPGQHQSKADVAEKVGSFVFKTIQAGREVAGIKPGTPSIADTNPDENQLTIVQQVIEPKVLPVNAEGRHIA